LKRLGGEAIRTALSDLLSTEGDQRATRCAESVSGLLQEACICP